MWIERMWIAAMLIAGAALVGAQDQSGSTSAVDAAPADKGERLIGDPYEAYSSGVYGQALQGFVNDQVERPEDFDVLFNIASAHYQMKNYEEARKGFGQVALGGDPPLRSQALYNLGNCAYREGKLQEAVDLYKAALELNPDDEDAKFNLEFVRDEIRRRHEEAQKRQKEKNQQNQDQKQQQQGQESQESQDQQQGNDGQQGQAEDSDRDGLPDEAERSGENPTDPEDADSDDDGLLDGQEDRNRNGKVDPDETNPNDPDSDDDGLTDGQEAAGEQSEGSQQAQSKEAAAEGLSREEAERYLQALREGRPVQKRPAKPGQRRRPLKDW